jgi:hypothetical protein
MEALRLPRPLAGASVMALLDKLYSQRDHFSTYVPQLSTGHVQQIHSTYYAIDAMATDFAVCALERISPKGRVGSANTPLSPAEHFRFRRAFYRVELFYTLFRCGAFDDNMNCWFFSRYPPWENEQLGCVSQYLRARLDQGS